MKARKSIIVLVVVSMLLVLTDGVLHCFKALEARKILTIIKPDDQNFEWVHDTLHGNCWSVIRDVVVMAAQGIVIVLAMKATHPNQSLQPTAAALLGRDDL